MSEVRYKAYKVIAYNPNGPSDSAWDRAIEREIAKTELRGAMRAFEENPLTKIASKT